MAGKTLTTPSGERITYLDAGAGPPLMLLHSVGLSRRSFEPAMALLADDFRVVAWDMPGHGTSSHPATPLSIAGYADVLSLVLDAAGIDDAHIAGVSIGAHIGASLAARYPERVLSLVLVEGGFQNEAGWATAWSAVEKTFSQPVQSFEQVAPRFRAFDAGLLQQWNEDRSRAGGETMMDAMRAIRDYRFMDDLPAIRCPTLAVYGDKSPMRGSAEVLASAIPGLRKTVMPDCGHFPMLDDPSFFCRIIGDFALSAQP